MTTSTILHSATHHGVEAVGQMPAQASRGRALVAQLPDLFLRLVEHLQALGVPLGQLVQLRHTHIRAHQSVIVTNQCLLV